VLVCRARTGNYSNKHAHRDNKQVIVVITIIEETAVSLKEQNVRHLMMVILG
jgi:hypothetical protein